LLGQSPKGNHFPLFAYAHTVLSWGLDLGRRMLLTKRKSAQRQLISAAKAERRAGLAASPDDGALDREKQLAVVDAVEWAAERWAARDLAPPNAPNPRAAHAVRLIAALVYLDARFARLDPSLVIQVVERVTSSSPAGDTGPRLDAKAAAALLAVEVGAFRR
jgi:hypothetical protein